MGCRELIGPVLQLLQAGRPVGWPELARQFPEGVVAADRDEGNRAGTG